MLSQAEQELVAKLGDLASAHDIVKYEAFDNKKGKFHFMKLKSYF